MHYIIHQSVAQTYNIYYIYYIVWILLCTPMCNLCIYNLYAKTTHTHTHTHRYLVQNKADVRTRSNKGKLARELAADVQTVAAF